MCVVYTSKKWGLLINSDLLVKVINYLICGNKLLTKKTEKKIKRLLTF